MHSSRMHTTCSSSRQLGGRGGGQVESTSVHAGIHQPPSLGVGLKFPQMWAGDPPVWAWRPPVCGPGDTPRCGPGEPATPSPVRAWSLPWPDPSSSPLGVGLETYKACWDTHSHPWGPARHAGIPHPPPCTEFLTHATENITLPQTLFAGSKNDL